jgi:hypothetical protein
LISFPDEAQTQPSAVQHATPSARPAQAFGATGS